MRLLILGGLRFNGRKKWHLRRLFKIPEHLAADIFYGCAICVDADMACIFVQQKAHCKGLLLFVTQGC
ncbi:MAG: hypothetical protein R6T90_09105 [Dissulfuribacterales bacterium]